MRETPMKIADLSKLAAHVMIRGQVFGSANKAPFAASGVSVFGAVEYDYARDVLRCHECGEWFKSLSNHIGHGSHEMSLRDYKGRHGLRLITALVSKTHTEKKSKAAFVSRNGDIANSMLHRDPSKPIARALSINQSEERNEFGRCPAQMYFKIMRLSVEVNGTPTVTQLKAAGISPSTFFRSLGVKTLTEAYLIIGLEPNHAYRPKPTDSGWM